MNRFLNQYHQLIAVLSLSLLISCGGPGVIVNEGEYTKKLPETTKAVEKIKPLIEKFESEQNEARSEQELKAKVKAQAGSIEDRAKEKPLKLLSSRSNFMTARELSSEADESVCDLQQLVIAEELIDNQKIISLAERFSKCPEPRGLQKIDRSDNKTEIRISIPSFWLSRKMILSSPIEIHTEGQPLVIVTEHLSLNTLISTRPSPRAKDRLAGSIRLAALVTEIGIDGALDLVSGQISGPSFDELTPEHQRRIVQRAFEEQSPRDPVPTDELNGPDIGKLSEQLFSRAIKRIINDLPRDWKFKSVKMFYEGTASRFNPLWMKKFIAGRSEYFSVVPPTPGISVYPVALSTLRAVFTLSRRGSAPDSLSTLEVSPQILPLSLEDPSKIPGVELVSLLPLSRKLPITEPRDRILYVQEFSPFSMNPKRKISLKTTAQMSLSIYHLQKGLENPDEVENLLPSPEVIQISESWEVIPYSEATIRSQALASSTHHLDEIQAEHSSREIISAVRSWNIPQEALESPVLKRFWSIERDKFQ